MKKRAELSGRVALIAGASRPVGRAIADMFGQSGAALILPFHSDWPESTDDLRRHVERAGYDCLLLPCDLTSSSQVNDLIDKAEDAYGKLHYLINNIERGGMPIVHGPYELPVNQNQWELEFSTTVTAKRNLYRRCIALMKDSGQGAVINISSIAARVGRSGPASAIFSEGYSAASRSVGSFTEQWAREAAPAVTVNEIMLGLCKTRHGEHTRGWSLMSEDQRNDLLEHTLLERTATPEELAELVYFLAVRARYMTGSTIVYDGGYLLGGAEVRDMPAGDLQGPH